MKAIFVGGKMHKIVIETEDVIKQDLLKVLRYTDDLSLQRGRGELVHRKELDNQPIFEGYLSPMWDGDRLRYETQEVYNMMSI